MVNSIYSQLFKKIKKNKIEIFDHKFDLKKNNEFEVSKNFDESLNRNMIYIFNYLDDKNKKKLIYHLKKNNNKLLININTNENNIFDKKNNCKNIFDKSQKRSN